MRRAIVTVKGKVQKVRYRSKVKEIADGLGIVGEVENREGFGKRGEKIGSIKEDTGEMKDTLSFLNLEAVHRETLELKEKYELLSKDVAEIKIKVNSG